MRPPSARNVPLTRSTGAHPDDRGPKAKFRFPDVTGIQPPPVRVVSKPKAKAEPVVIQPPAPVALPGQGLKEKGPPIDPDIEPANEAGSSSAGPPAIPGLPVTEGEFPIVPLSPAPPDAVPIPESGSESDSDRTVDYRDDPATLLALVESSDDGYLDNGALRLADKRKLSRDVNFLTGRWVLTVKVDKNGYFSKFKARWVCRGFQDKHAWEQQTDSPTATRYGFRLVAQCAANNFWDLFHLDLKTAFLQGEHYNLESRSVVIQLPHDIGLPPWMVGVCLRPVYGLNDAPRRWWNRLDKFLRSIGLEPTRADRCTYVAYQGTEKRHNASIAQEGCGTLIPVPPSGDPGASSYLNEVALSALNCYAYDEGSQSPSDTAEERSYMSCPDIASCFESVSTKKVVDYAWRPVTDQKLLGFLGGVAHKKRGWFPYENGHALVSHRAKALRGPEPNFKVKDYPYRVSFILRQGTWWVVERAQDLRLNNKPCYLEEEAEVLVTMFLPEKASYKVDSLS